MYIVYVMHGGGVMPDRQAGTGFSKYSAESPKQDSKRFNSITKTIHSAHLGILCISAAGIGISGLRMRDGTTQPVGWRSIDYKSDLNLMARGR